MQAREVAENKHNTQITPLHLTLAFLDGAAEGYMNLLLQKIGAEVPRLRSTFNKALERLPQQNPPPDTVSPDSALMKVFKAADALRKAAGDSHLAIDHLIQVWCACRVPTYSRTC
jgi:ATP-dependent Clp protease ATP-binding subunit ClpB